jgi:uncharacterized membrane protein
MKGEISLRKKSLISKGFFGLTWICIGVIRIFQSNIILDLISIVIIILGIVAQLISYFVKTQKEDEMSDNNEYKSKSTVYELLVIIISLCIGVSTVKGIWTINLGIIIPILLGMVNLLEFILFNYYEKIGD